MIQVSRMVIWQRADEDEVGEGELGGESSEMLCSTQLPQPTPSWGVLLGQAGGRGSNTFIIIHLHPCIHVTKYSMQIFLGFSQVLVRGGTILRRGAMQYASLSHS